MLPIIYRVKNAVQDELGLVKTFLRDELGLTTVEYAIAGGLVGAAVIAVFLLLGETVGNIIQGIIDELTQ